MKKLPNLDFRFFKFLWLTLIIVGLNGAAFSATFTVTKTADTSDNVCDADCSLREAVAAANAAASDDVINFDAIAFATTQTITLVNGQLIISHNSNLSIDGTGANLLTISGNNANSVFFIQSSAIVVINDLKISDGKILGNGNGGGIANLGGTVTINNSIISNNSTNLEAWHSAQPATSRLLMLSFPNGQS